MTDRMGTTSLSPAAFLVLLYSLLGWGGSLRAEDAQPSAPRRTVTFESLLREMGDCDSLARFPAPEYRQLQSSSYNRRSVSRDQPDQGTQGWFADSDGVSWIRDETVNGRREFVIMEHDGPGCITRVWTPFFYYGFNNRVGPRIRIYLDGSDTPVIDGHFIESMGVSSRIGLTCIAGISRWRRRTSASWSPPTTPW